MTSPTEEREVLLLDVKVRPASLQLDLRQIYQALHPTAPVDQLVTEELTEGAVNCMYRCNLLDRPLSEAVIVRLFNFKMDSSSFSEEKDPLQNRQLEFEAMCAASRLGICSPVYARFANGIVYGYVIGQTLRLEEVHDLALGKKIATQVARLHTLHIVNRRTAQPTQFDRWRSEQKPKFQKLFDHIQASIDRSPVEEYKFLPRLSEVRSWITALEDRLQALGMGEVGFCHNDLNLSNIIWNREADRVQLLDFEWSELNYTFIDIAVHFASFPGFFMEDYVNARLPSVDYQREWIRHYQRELNALKARRMEPAEFDRLCEQTRLKATVYMQIVKLNYVLRAPIWDFPADGVSRAKGTAEKVPNKIALYCLSALTGYREDKQKVDEILERLEREKPLERPATEQPEQPEQPAKKPENSEQ